MPPKPFPKNDHFIGCSICGEPSECNLILDKSGIKRPYCKKCLKEIAAQARKEGHTEAADIFEKMIIDQIK